MNIFPLYNLFFKISIDFVKSFQSNLEIYFQSITSILKHKLDNKTKDLKYNYIRLFEDIIENSYEILNNRLDTKETSSVKYKLYNTYIS